MKYNFILFTDGRLFHQLNVDQKLYVRFFLARILLLAKLVLFMHGPLQ